MADDIESGIAALLIKLVFKVPFVFDFIDDYSLIASYERKILRYYALKYLEKVIPKFADFVIVVDPIKEDFCLNIGISEEKLMVIPNGVDTDVFKPKIQDQAIRDELNPHDNNLVVYVGKINKYYCLDTILLAIPKVLNELPETKFVCVGDGDDVTNLKDLSKRLKIEKSVIFTGFRPSNEIPKIINLSDVCVFPLPACSALVIFEYMACAKPVVLPRGGGKKMGISQEIIPENCGFQVENSPEGFAQGINSLLRNEKVRKEIGEKAMELTVTFYDWEKLAGEYRDVLTQVVHYTKRKG